MKHAGRAFTLLELILAIATISVLMVILLASVAGVRRSGREAATLSNLRQHYAVFLAYAGDYGDSWPLLIAPPPVSTPLSPGVVVREPYFAQHQTWPQHMSDGYYAGASLALFKSPVSRSPVVAYYYGCSFIAKPEYWTGQSDASPSLWGPTRHPDVTYPAAKALLLDYGSWWAVASPADQGRAKLPAVFVDGSVDTPIGSSLFPGCSSGDGPWVGAMHFQDSFPGLHTLHGVRGRDRREP